MSLIVAIEALRSHTIPAVVGLHTPIPDAAGLDLVRDEPVHTAERLAQIDAFGFGGVNAVTLVEV